MEDTEILDELFIFGRTVDSMVGHGLSLRRSHSGGTSRSTAPTEGIGIELGGGFVCDFGGWDPMGANWNWSLTVDDRM